MRTSVGEHPDLAERDFRHRLSIRRRVSASRWSLFIRSSESFYLCFPLLSDFAMKSVNFTEEVEGKKEVDERLIRCDLRVYKSFFS